MEEKYYSGSIIPESNRVIFESWLNEHHITYSRTEVVERPVLDGNLYTTERAFGYLLLMSKDEYTAMLREFNDEFRKETNEI